MPDPARTPEDCFGYLSTIVTPEHGYFGAYLILSALGRPLEFHCTSPVRPSRAQEILYGTALQPYLVGEQIGGALLAAAKLTPLVILTDHPAMLEIRVRCTSPLVYIAPPALEETSGGCRAGSFQPELQCAAGFESDRAITAEAIGSLAQHVDLLEPFARIREAIQEAQRLGARGDDAHGEAA